MNGTHRKLAAMVVVEMEEELIARFVELIQIEILPSCVTESSLLTFQLLKHHFPISMPPHTVPY